LPSRDLGARESTDTSPHTLTIHPSLSP
jgi:hypothetical protein